MNSRSPYETTIGKSSFVRAIIGLTLALSVHLESHAGRLCSETIGLEARTAFGITSFERRLPEAEFLFRFGLFWPPEVGFWGQIKRTLLQRNRPIFQKETALYSEHFAPKKVRDFHSAYEYMSAMFSRMEDQTGSDIPIFITRFSYQIIRYLHRMDPHRPSILFALDDYKMPENFLKTSPFALEGSRYTDQELSILLLNPHYFKIVRWFRNNKELSPNQVRSEFQDVAPWLFDRRIPPPRPVFEVHLPESKDRYNQQFYETNQGRHFILD